MKKLISIIIPAYNEELVIKELARRLSGVMGKLAKFRFEVIVVDNGSGDNTIGELLKVRVKDPRFKVIQLTKNEGCDGGIIAGLSFAQGDAAIVMMADLQESPDLIVRFIRNSRSSAIIISITIIAVTNEGEWVAFSLIIAGPMKIMI